jgi:stage II sporulation protein D
MPQVKVLIGKSLKDVVVHGTDLRQTIPAKKLFRDFNGRQTVNFNCRIGQQVVLPEKPLLVASVTSPTGLVGWEDKRFKGELQLVAGPDAAKFGCDLVNLIPMDAYISSLLAKEMNATWPLEALKAQAVVARSYALSKMRPSIAGGPWHLESSEKNQVSGQFHDTTANTDRAARETEGEVLTDEIKRPVEGFFHSKCGGHTLRPDQVWSGEVAGYRGVDCPFCHKYGRKKWNDAVSRAEFAGLLTRALNRYSNASVRILPNNLTFVGDAAHRSELRFYHGNDLHVVKKSWLRNLAGRDTFPSHNFRVVDAGEGIRVTGEGYGHGVGLCQLGALELAKRGYGYRAILQHYFPELKVSRIW